MMDFLCMQRMHCQSLPFNAIKRSFLCFTLKHFKSDSLKLFGVIQSWFSLHHIIIQIWFLLRLHKKSHKTTFFRLESFSSLRLCKISRHRKHRLRIKHAFQIMQICITFRVFSTISLRARLSRKNLRAKVDQNNFNQEFYILFLPGTD